MKWPIEGWRIVRLVLTIWSAADKQGTHMQRERERVCLVEYRFGISYLIFLALSPKVDGRFTILGKCAFTMFAKRIDHGGTCFFIRTHSNNPRQTEWRKYRRKLSSYRAQRSRGASCEISQTLKTQHSTLHRGREVQAARSQNTQHSTLNYLPSTFSRLFLIKLPIPNESTSNYFVEVTTLTAALIISLTVPG